MNSANQHATGFHKNYPQVPKLFSETRWGDWQGNAQFKLNWLNYDIVTPQTQLYPFHINRLFAQIRWTIKLCFTNNAGRYSYSTKSGAFKLRKPNPQVFSTPTASGWVL